MFGVEVKTEASSATCRGCLSTDRRLSPLVNYNLYFSLLSEKQKLEVMMEPEILVCWECNAAMRKMMAFKTQVQQAHMVLESFEENAGVKTSLSRLKFCQKQDYDVIIEETTDETLDKVSYSVPSTIYNKEEISLDETNKNETDNENVNHSDYDNSDHFDVNVHDSSSKDSVNLSLRKKRATNGVIKSRIKVKKLLPQRENLKRAVKKTIPSTNERKRKRKPKKINKKLKKVKQEVCIPIQNAEEPVKIEYNNKIEKIVTEEHYDKIEEIVSERDSDDESNHNSDPDFELEVPNVAETTGPPKTVKKYDRHRPDYEKAEDHESVMFRAEKFKYCFRELDTFFTELALSEEEIARALEKQPSYKTALCKYECIYCGICFQLNRTMQKHWKTVHKQLIKSLKCKDPESPGCYRYRMYRCVACQAVVRAEHVEAHMRYTHPRRFYCNQCHEDFWDQEVVKAHWKSCHWPYVCDHCGATMTSKTILEKHMWQNHKARHPLSCEDCGKTLISNYNLQMHRLRKHVKEDSNPELRYCVQCDKQYASIYLYEQHLSKTVTHSAGETYPCSACDKVLNSKSRLKYHFDRAHSENAPLFQCPHCQRRLTHKNALDVHVNRIHLKIRKPKNKICSICGRAFANNRHLIHHVRTHTGERPHTCALCPAAFTQKHSLVMHVAAKHKDQSANV